MVRSWLKRIERPSGLPALAEALPGLHPRPGGVHAKGRRRRQDGGRPRPSPRPAGGAPRPVPLVLPEFAGEHRLSPPPAQALRRVSPGRRGPPRELGHARPSTRLLGDHRAAFCNIDQPLFEDSIKPSAVSTTPDFAYVRLHGRNYKNWFREDAGRDDRYDYLYAADELEEWITRIKDLGTKSGKVYVITNNHYRGQAMANALQIRNMITGEKVDIPDLLLEKYPVLREIVRAIRAGQMDLFRRGARKSGTTTREARHELVGNGFRLCPREPAPGRRPGRGRPGRALRDAALRLREGPDPRALRPARRRLRPPLGAPGPDLLRHEGQSAPRHPAAAPSGGAPGSTPYRPARSRRPSRPASRPSASCSPGRASAGPTSGRSSPSTA